MLEWIPEVNPLPGSGWDGEEAIMERYVGYRDWGRDDDSTLSEDGDIDDLWVDLGGEG